MIRPGTIRLGNKRSYSDHKPEAGERVIDIDRPHPLSNPFVVSKSACRQTCLFAFKLDFEGEMAKMEGKRFRLVQEIISKLREGQDVILMCWCHPLPCHGDTIKAYIEERLK
jgi:hypothetical protein